MRSNSQKQIEASRRNGSKSNGPKTPAGKTKVAQNAIGNGLFARQVVIGSLGEKQEAYDLLKQQVWDVLKPKNVVEEMLALDFVENWRRRERIRRAETGELENRAKVLKLRRDLNEERRFEHLTAVVDGDMSQRFARAETAVERRMYRALVALAAMQGESVSNLLPGPTSPAESRNGGKGKIAKQT